MSGRQACWSPFRVQCVRCLSAAVFAHGVRHGMRVLTCHMHSHPHHLRPALQTTCCRTTCCRERRRRGRGSGGGAAGQTRTASVRRRTRRMARARSGRMRRRAGGAGSATRWLTARRTRTMARRSWRPRRMSGGSSAWRKRSSGWTQAGGWGPHGWPGGGEGGAVRCAAHCLPVRSSSLCGCAVPSAILLTAAHSLSLVQAAGGGGPGPEGLVHAGRGGRRCGVVG